MIDVKSKWENIYTNKQDNEVSWFQENPEISILLIEKYSLKNKKSKIVDIGGGNSLLTSELVNKGYDDLCVLDISAKALERSRERIKGATVKWLVGDVLECEQLNQIDVWHDRALFHFLTERNEVAKYINIATKAINKSGVLILGTFSVTGLEKCSGLPIVQYSEGKFRELFKGNFNLVECFDETHTTPFNTKQNFIWGVFVRK
jgi:SAM-dependent methyltransferase